jgi:hypothetical protein
MLNFGDAMYEADLHTQAVGRTSEANLAPRSRKSRGFSFADMFREAMARLGDWLINVGCELEVRYLAEGRPTPCAS